MHFYFSGVVKMGVKISFMLIYCYGKDLWGHSFSGCAKCSGELGFIAPGCAAVVCVSGGKEYSFFGAFCVRSGWVVPRDAGMGPRLQWLWRGVLWAGVMGGGVWGGFWFSCWVMHCGWGLISIFQEFFGSIGKVFILVWGLGAARLSFYGI